MSFNLTGLASSPMNLTHLQAEGGNWPARVKALARRITAPVAILAGDRENPCYVIPPRPLVSKLRMTRATESNRAGQPAENPATVSTATTSPCPSSLNMSPDHHRQRSLGTAKFHHRNAEPIMSEFYRRQRNDVRCVHENGTADTFKFTLQRTASSCAMMFTGGGQSDANNFKGQCSRMVICYRFNRQQALPRRQRRFPRLAQRLAASCAASREPDTRCPRASLRAIRRDDRNMFRQWPGSDRQAADECPRRRLASRLASDPECPRHGQDGIRQISLPDDSRPARRFVGAGRVRSAWRPATRRTGGSSGPCRRSAAPRIDGAAPACGRHNQTKPNHERSQNYAPRS